MRRGVNDDLGPARNKSHSPVIFPSSRSGSGGPARRHPVALDQVVREIARCARCERLAPAVPSPVGVSREHASQPRIALNAAGQRELNSRPDYAGSSSDFKRISSPSRPPCMSAEPDGECTTPGLAPPRLRVIERVPSPQERHRRLKITPLATAQNGSAGNAPIRRGCSSIRISWLYWPAGRNANKPV